MEQEPRVTHWGEPPGEPQTTRDVRVSGMLSALVFTVFCVSLGVGLHLLTGEGMKAVMGGIFSGLLYQLCLVVQNMARM
jgi:hypothetical protein